MEARSLTSATTTALRPSSVARYWAKAASWPRRIRPKRSTPSDRAGQAPVLVGAIGAVSFESGGSARRDACAAL